jgi:signal transduction histidine kinase
MPTFTVDTHLFRELGDLLVGRDSTALIELIKNSYDADAEAVTVYGHNLGSKDAGFIQISDNGNGMGPDDFLQGFLRIASRLKEEGDRRSPHFGRRFTGAKGIGRLAAHKLARLLSIKSVPYNDGKNLSRKGIDASIDWDVIEELKTLDQVEGSDAITIDKIPVPAKAKSGTTITLRRLRKPWSNAERDNFVLEVQSFTPPQALVTLPKIINGRLLNPKITVRDSGHSGKSHDPGFNVSLEGSFSHGEDLWETSAKAAHWLIEIDSNENDGDIHYSISPTNRLLAKHPKAAGGKYKEKHPDPKNGPFFHGRILVKTDKAFKPRLAGIRVFMEGFRVLPYGGQGDDWLLLDRDYTQRGDKLRMLKRSPLDDNEQEEDADDDAYGKEGLSILPNKSYAGAIFLTANRASTLRMLVNREGFVPESGYQTLFNIVRKGVDLSTRLRAASRQVEKKIPSAPENTTVSKDPGPEKRAQEAEVFVQEAKGRVAKGDFKGAASALKNAVGILKPVTAQATALIEERSMLRVVASIGTQFSGFIHEIRSLVGIVHTVDNSLSSLRSQGGLNPKLRNGLGALHSTIADLRKILERHASYLMDVVTPDVRRRRKKLSFSDRFDSGVKIVAHAAEKNGVKISNKIDISMVSPPMYPAELTVIFSNLLTNAIKAAGENGEILATGKEEASTQRIIIENTGTEVDLKNSERWFEPFESTTTKVDPILGQGMGLGLTITRAILEEYGASIKFIPPSKGFSTAVEVAFT